MEESKKNFDAFNLGSIFTQRNTITLGYESLYQIDFETRKKICYFLSFTPLLIYRKLRIKYVLFGYVYFSLLICKENLNPYTYMRNDNEV